MRIYKWEIGTLGILGIALSFIGVYVGFSLIVSGNLELDWIGWVMFIVGWVMVFVDISRSRKKHIS